jgi:molybdenum cofactor guanylyltransferase
MMKHIAGVVLCGGKSSRMGRPKAWLPFGEEMMLQRIVRIVREVVEPVVVVAAPDQSLPSLPKEVLRTHDHREGRGPLEGLLAGLKCLAEFDSSLEAAYVTSCDVPLLVPELIRYLLAEREGHDVVVPVDAQFHHPLSAVYRLSICSEIEQLLARDELRPRALFERAATRRVPVEELRRVDSQLYSLMNLNHRDDYEQALRIARDLVPPR